MKITYNLSANELSSIAQERILGSRGANTYEVNDIYFDISHNDNGEPFVKGLNIVIIERDE